MASVVSSTVASLPRRCPSGCLQQAMSLRYIPARRRVIQNVRSCITLTMKLNLLLCLAFAGLVACDNGSSPAPDDAVKSPPRKPPATTRSKPAPHSLPARNDATDPDRIRVGNSKVTFIAPEGFQPLSKELIATKWPTNQAPAYAVGTSSGSTSVAYDLKPRHVPQEALSEAQKAFTEVFERVIPGLEWRKNEIIEHSGQKWLLMEMTSNAVDTDIYNIMMLTGIDGKMLVFNFNSTREDFPRYEEELRKSLNSIELP